MGVLILVSIISIIIDIMFLIRAFQVKGIDAKLNILIIILTTIILVVLAYIHYIVTLSLPEAIV